MMKRLFITVITLIILIPAVRVLSGGEKTQDKPMPAQETAPANELTNIHYSSKYCAECHENTPQKGMNKSLKSGGDFTQLCRCHGYTTDIYIHPVNIAPSEEKKAKIPRTFPLANGKITCVTCHDIYLQCQDDRKSKRDNPKFLRGTPFRKRTDICIKCHEGKKYRMLDPHNQLNAAGEVIEEKCLLCHEEKPDINKTTFENVKLIGDLVILCERCHGDHRIHPARIDHRLQPSAELLAMMKDSEKKFDTILPLDSEGNITCITCHNPHERGAIPSERTSAKGASEKYRHRVPGQMCTACHQK